MVSSIQKTELFYETYGETAKLYTALIEKFHIDMESSMINSYTPEMLYSVRRNYKNYGIDQEPEGHKHLCTFTYFDCMRTYINAVIAANNINLIDFLHCKFAKDTIFVPAVTPDLSEYDAVPKPTTEKMLAAFMNELEVYTKRYKTNIYIWRIRVDANNIINSNSTYSVEHRKSLNNVIDYINQLDIYFSNNDDKWISAIDYFNTVVSQYYQKTQYTAVDYENFLSNTLDKIYKALGE
jgi:hypothetical protein